MTVGDEDVVLEIIPRITSWTGSQRRRHRGGPRGSWTETGSEGTFVKGCGSGRRYGLGFVSDTRPARGQRLDGTGPGSQTDVSVTVGRREGHGDVEKDPRRPPERGHGP